MIKAAFFDIDGTIYSRTQMVIPERTVRALRKLHETGVLIYAATGRNVHSTFDVLGDGIPFDGYVTLNGQICLLGGERRLLGKPFPEEDRLRAARYFEERRHTYVMIGPEASFYNYEGETQYSIGRGLYRDVREYRGETVYQMTARMRPEDGEEIRGILKESAAYFWEGCGVDILPIGAGKTEGMRQVMEAEGITPEEVIAFGDAENDADMLRYAGIGVAMGNGDETVKAAAGYVTDTVDADGIEKALVRFGLIGDPE